jgi:rod shape-determining protein MreD
MKGLKLFAGLLFLFLLQTLIFPKISFYGVVPDLFFVVMVVLVVQTGLPRGFFYAFCLGLLQDFLSSPYYIHTLGLLGFAFVVVWVRDRFSGKAAFAAWFWAGLLTPLYIWSLCIILHVFYGISFALWGIFFRGMGAAVLNGAACFFVYPVLADNLAAPRFKFSKKDVISHL